MKTIDPITLARLNNANVSQFVKNILAITDQAAPESGLKTVTADLHEDLLSMSDSFIKKNLSEETKEITALDGLRDRAFRTLRRRTESYLLDDQLPGAVDYAEHIMVIIKRYGGSEIATFDLNKETATLTNLVADLQSEAADALQALNLMQTVMYMAQCNINFENKYATRGDAATEIGKIVPMNKLRPQVQANYTIFVKLIESLPYFNTAHAAAIGQVIDRINQEIKAFNALINNPAANPADAKA